MTWKTQSICSVWRWSLTAGVCTIFETFCSTIDYPFSNGPSNYWLSFVWNEYVSGVVMVAQSSLFSSCWTLGYLSVLNLRRLIPPSKFGAESSTTTFIFFFWNENSLLYLYSKCFSIFYLRLWHLFSVTFNIFFFTCFSLCSNVYEYIKLLSLLLWTIQTPECIAEPVSCFLRLSTSSR